MSHGRFTAMIPHHSTAILTSERAPISDPRLRALADRIIASQTRQQARRGGQDERGSGS